MLTATRTSTPSQRHRQPQRSAPTSPSTQYTLTYNAGVGGSISGDASQTVGYGDSGSAVTAVPNSGAGYHFVSWSDGVLTATRTDANVTANHSVTANFALNQYTLTYNAGVGGSISGDASQTVGYGDSGSAVTAVPNSGAGYHFVSWSDGVLTATRTDANVTANHSVTANFALNQYTLTYNAGVGGSISGDASQTVGYGDSGSAVTAVPNSGAGYHFVSWSDGVLTATRTDANVTANHSVTANFALNQYTLTYNAGVGGSISGDASQTVGYGDSGSAVTAVPNSGAGYHFVSWSDGVLTATRTDANVTANHSVTANFALDQYTLTYNAGVGGSISGDASQTVGYGDSGSAVRPSRHGAGYHFVSWSDGVLTATRTDANVTANHSDQRQLRHRTVTITASAGPNGAISPVDGRRPWTTARTSPSPSRRTPDTMSPTCSSTGTRSAR